MAYKGIVVIRPFSPDAADTGILTVFHRTAGHSPLYRGDVHVMDETYTEDFLTVCQKSTEPRPEHMIGLVGVMRYSRKRGR